MKRNNFLFWCASIILSIGIGYNVRVSNFKLIDAWGKTQMIQTGCMKSVTYILKRHKLPLDVRINTIYYCNSLK